MAESDYSWYTPPEPPTALWSPTSAIPREHVASPVPDWAAGRTSINPFILEPNRLTDGSAAVSPIFVGGSEAQDASYFTNNDPYGGSYLGVNEGLLPSYALMEKFGEKVGDNRGFNVGLGAPGTLQRIVNLDTGEVVYEGTDIEQIVKALDTVSADGNQTQWKVETYQPGYTDATTGEVGAESGWKTGYENVKEQSALGMLADYGLPIVMNALIPGSGLLHGALTAAGGSVLSGALQGKPIGDIAKSALISGVGGGIGGALGGAGSATGGGSLGLSPAFEAARGAGGSLISGLGGGIGAGLGGLADEAIMTVLGNSLGSGVGGAIGSGVGGALGTTLTSGGGGYQAQPGDSPMINVTAPTVSTGSLSGMAGLSGVGAQAVRDILAQQALAAQQGGQTQGDEITVTAPAVGGSALLPAVGLGGLGLAGLGAAAGGGGTATTAPIAETVDPEMVVTASPDGGLVIPPAVPSAGLNPGSLLPAAVPLVVPPTTLPPTQPRTLSDYINMVRGGLGVVGGIGSLLGGGGNVGGELPPGFNPNTGTVTYTPLNRTQNAAPFDPFTYGQTSGERSFFNPYELQYQTNVPSAQTTPAPAMKDGGEAEFDDSIEGHLAAYYSNGGHAGPGPVKGIGSGQEDKIPAWLSDGEYVWSAQDVADLGDGSSNEGVRRLDKMRQMVRKGAGRKDTKSIARPQKGIDTMLKAVGGAA